MALRCPHPSPGKEHPISATPKSCPTQDALKPQLVVCLLVLQTHSSLCLLCVSSLLSQENESFAKSFLPFFPFSTS